MLRKNYSQSRIVLRNGVGVIKGETIPALICNRCLIFFGDYIACGHASHRLNNIMHSSRTSARLIDPLIFIIEVFSPISINYCKWNFFIVF